MLATLLLALAPQANPRPSVVLLILDDIGTDQIAAHPNAIQDPPQTPTISALAAEGVQFTHAWGAPVCSPARAMVLTGRWPHRTGVGTIIQAGETFELALSEVTIAERVAARGYMGVRDYWEWPRVDDTPTTAAQEAAESRGLRRALLEILARETRTWAKPEGQERTG